MSKADEPRINGQIRSASIRLVDQNGNMVGVVSAADGLRMAEQAGLEYIGVQDHPYARRYLDAFVVIGDLLARNNEPLGRCARRMDLCEASGRETAKAERVAEGRPVGHVLDVARSAPGDGSHLLQRS